MAPRKTAYRRGNHRSGPKAKRQSLNNSIATFPRCLSDKADYDGSFPLEDIIGVRGNGARYNFNKNSRHTKISFVSGGLLERIEPKKIAKSSDSIALRPSNVSSKAATKADKKSTTAVKHSSEDHLSSEQVNLPDFIIDLQGSGFVETGFSSPRLGTISPAPSCSSDEVILFKGRKSFKTSIDTVSGEFKSSTGVSVTTESKIIEDVIPVKNSTKEGAVFPCSGISDTVVLPTPIDISCTNNEQAPICILQPNPVKGDVKGQIYNDLVTDYLENTDSLDVEAMVSFSKRDLGGSTEYEYKNDISSNRGPKGIDLTGLTWNSLYMHDYGLRVLSSIQDKNKDSKESSNQQEQNPTDHASSTSSFAPRGVSTISSLKNSEANNHLAFEVSDRSENESSDSERLSSMYDDDLDEGRYEYFDLEYDTESDEDIDDNLLFATHEELEMSSKNGFIHDDNKMQSSRTVPDQIPYSCAKNKKKDKKKKKKKEKEKEKSIAKAAKKKTGINYVIDDLNRLNVNDFDNFRHTKSRTLKIDNLSESSDSNTEGYLNQIIQNDLSKKRERKKQREVLRANGTLGYKNKKAPIRNFYKNGMSIKALKIELEIFLKGNQSNLSLPPMPKKDRKIVHGIANLVKLKSKSIGNGAQRFTILYRTAHTSVCAKDAFRFLEMDPALRKYPGQNKKNKKAMFKKNARTTKNVNPLVSYQDGDIVGASAPELAADNRGRAILEKMGWSSGTALGAHDNKGRLQPVSQIVKTTKAGLK